MPTIEITDQEFASLMAVLARAQGEGITWAVLNPLIMNIGGQAQQQQAAKAEAARKAAALLVNPPPPGNGQEAHHE